MTGKQTSLKDTDASAGRHRELLQQPLSTPQAIERDFQQHNQQDPAEALPTDQFRSHYRDMMARLQLFCLNLPHIRALKPQNKTLFQLVQSCQKAKKSVSTGVQHLKQQASPAGQLVSTTDRDNAALADSRNPPGGTWPGEEEEEAAAKQHQDQCFPCH